LVGVVLESLEYQGLVDLVVLVLVVVSQVMSLVPLRALQERQPVVLVALALVVSQAPSQALPLVVFLVPGLVVLVGLFLGPCLAVLQQLFPVPPWGPFQGPP
jgi:hypothetical protein